MSSRSCSVDVCWLACRTGVARARRACQRFTDDRNDHFVRLTVTQQGQPNFLGRLEALENLEGVGLPFQRTPIDVGNDVPHLHVDALAHQSFLHLGETKTDELLTLHDGLNGETLQERAQSGGYVARENWRMG